MQDNIITPSFETLRLSVSPWPSNRTEVNELAKTMLSLLTEAVLQTLPPNWQLMDSIAEAKQWISKREAESYCFAIELKAESKMIGVLLLDKPDLAENSVDLRIGYLLGKAYWGQGYAGELIQGLCKAYQDHERVKSLIGGVDPTNVASVKVLTKNGFTLDSLNSSDANQFYVYRC